jgi:two-component system cell cycle sensor histidine kinase/response regulator CckA
MPPAVTETSEPQSVLQRASRDWYWMPTAVLVVGILSLGLVFGANMVQERLIVRDIARVQVLGEIQRDLAVSHLWLEEYVSGDLTVETSEIGDRMASSLRLCRRLIDGSVALPALDDVRPLADPELLQQARLLREKILGFKDISNVRRQGYEAGDFEVVRIGSELDQEYDRIFSDSLTLAEDLERQIRDRLAANRDRSRILFRTIYGTWIAIVTLAVTGLWTRERRRKQAEEALRRSEAQLLQSQKMEAVGRLAGGIAHDVNNYLAAITAQCELVKRKAEPGGRVATKMDAIISSSFRVSSLIKRLLAFSRQQPVQPEIVNLNRVVEELGKMMERLIGEDVRLESHLSDELWNVKIDPSQIEQIIVNLLVNSRDALPTGGRVSIETANLRLDEDLVRLQGSLDAGDYVRLSVSDTGTGIEPQILDKIFEPFFTTKGQSGSSGLGLATVYGIVEQNGGTIEVQSEVHSGTIFQIYLPRCPEVATGATSFSEPAMASAAGGSERILLVEDNEELRRSTKGVLQAMGYRVTVAADGERGLRTFEAAPRDCDLVVTDVVMPGMSGRELVDRIRWLDPEVKVLFVSGYTDNVILRHGIMEGEVDFLEKPFTADLLARKVREVLDRKPRAPVKATAGA